MTRTAQWGGEGRPETGSSFLDLLLGQDNLGEGGITVENEPGNQLAGFDLKVSLPFRSHALNVHTQWMGEDEAGGFPSRYLGQAGASLAGGLGQATYRWHLEYADTTCDFIKNDPIYNCGYNTAIYPNGYRYRGRPLGHTADNDAQTTTMGWFIQHPRWHAWDLTLRRARLNQGGGVDPRNVVSATPQVWQSVDLVHTRRFKRWMFDVAAGYEDRDTTGTLPGSHDWRTYIQLRTVR